MQTQEIVKLTRKRIAEIVKARQDAGKLPTEQSHVERRKSARWPFKGAIELWPDGADGRSLTHGTCLNISETGMGLSCDEHLNPSQIMEVAIHLPEMTLCGRATVHYCAEVRGQYMIGMEFVF